MTGKAKKPFLLENGFSHLGNKYLFINIAIDEKIFIFC